MKQIRLLAVFLFFTQLLIAQKITVNTFSAIDKKALALPDSLSKTTTSIAQYISSNFDNNTDKARAIFIWTVTNIQYDIENMYAINIYQPTEDKINKALTTRKGICEDYAAVFNDLCLKTGIKSFMIGGYTKQNGFRDYIPHAWCAALIDTAWFLFDPTWGSGYVANSGFHKQINNKYFKANPSTLIKTHMPFDYLWQLLYYSVTSQEFYESKTLENSSKPYFNYKDSIAAYEKENHMQQLNDEAYRIEKNGIKNSMIFDRLQHIKMEIENDRIAKENERQKNMAGFYNTASVNYNDAVNFFNAFIDYRNHQFKPEKTDVDIQKMLDTVNAKLTTAKTNLRQIEYPGAENEMLLAQFRKMIVDLDANIKEQQDWLNTYFSKSKSKRRSMLYEKKITWFGVPLN